MTVSRLARRERPQEAIAALQSLARPRLPCGSRLALTSWGRSEWVNM